MHAQVRLFMRLVRGPSSSSPGSGPVCHQQAPKQRRRYGNDRHNHGARSVQQIVSCCRQGLCSHVNCR